MRFIDFIKLVSIPVLSANIFYGNAWFFLLAIDSETLHKGVLNFFYEYFGIVLYVLSFGIIPSFIDVILIGWPIFYLANKFNLVSYFSVTISGVLLSILPYAFIHFFNTISFNTKINILCTLSIGGFLASLIFWKNFCKFTTVRRLN